MYFQLISLRLIQTPDKANKFYPSVDVRINAILLYLYHVKAEILQIKWILIICAEIMT